MSNGESWDSSCEKSRVPVQNQWVPVKKKMSPKLKIPGPLCSQTVNLKTDSKTLYYTNGSPSILKEIWTAIITATEITWTGGIFLQIDMLRSIELLAWFRNPWAVFWIPKPTIPDSTRKFFPDSGLHKQNLPNSGIWSPLHEVNKSWANF